MLFTPENAKKVMKGKKTRTTRLTIPHWLVEGKVIAVQPGRGKYGIGHIQIDTIEVVEFWDFVSMVYESEYFAQYEGRSNPADFIQHLLQLAGKNKTWELVNKNPELYVIDFHVVKK